MTGPLPPDDWTSAFQGTRALPRPLRDRLLEVARIAHIPKGNLVFGQTNPPDNLLFLYQGTIRVSQTSDTGREIVLYRVEGGESCVLTTACMMAEQAYHAEGLAETDLTTINLPKPVFERFVAEEPAFRDFVMTAYSRRLIDLMRVVDEVAFGRIDMRLADRLLAIAGDDTTVAATHQDLAAELGTAREVISRVLQDFQKRALITQTRGRITLTDTTGLGVLAGSD